MAKKEEAVVETETHEVEEVVETETPAAVEKPATAAEIAAAVAAAVRPAGASPEDRQRQEYQERINREVARTGKTADEVVADDNARRESNLHDMRPQLEELGASKAEKIIGDDPELMEKVKELIASYKNIHVSTNPKAWEDAAHIIRSRSGKVGPAKKTASTEETTERPAGKVLGGNTRQHTGLTDGQRTSGGARKAAAKKEYSEEQMAFIERDFGGDVDEFEKYSASKKLPSRTREEVSSKNKADIEAERLSGKRAW